MRRADTDYDLCHGRESPIVTTVERYDDQPLPSKGSITSLLRQQHFFQLRDHSRLKFIELSQLLRYRGPVDDFDIQLRLAGFRQQFGILQGAHKRLLQELKPLLR